MSLGALHEIYFGAADDNVELVQDDEFSIHRLCRVASEHNLADLFTKPLEVEKHWYMMSLVRMVALR